MKEPEGLQKLPHWSWAWPETAGTDRAETGPMQFGDDWPGVFIRGDNALAYANAIESYLRFSETLHGVRPLGSTEMLHGLRDLLRSCSVGNTGWPP